MLTKDQQSKVDAVIDSWFARQTKPLNREAAKDSLLAMDLEPAGVLFFDSPLACCAAATIVSQLYSQLDSQLDSQLRSQLDSQLYSQLRSQLYSQLYSQLRSQLYSQLDSQLRSQLYSQLDSQLRSQLDSQLDSQLRSQLDSQLDSQLGLSISIWWSYWVAFGEIANQMGYNTKETESWKFVRNVKFVAFSQNGFACISENPTAIRWDESRTVLHCDDGPSVEYKDGWKLWTVNGVRLPHEYGEQIVMRPETQTIKEIKTEKNEEIKRIRIERFGWSRFLQESNAKVLDTRRNDIENTEEAIMQTGDGMRVLVPTCKTGRLFSLEVPPEVETCEQAQDWLNSGSRIDELIGPTRTIGRT